MRRGTNGRGAAQRALTLTRMVQTHRERWCGSFSGTGRAIKLLPVLYRRRFNGLRRPLRFEARPVASAPLSRSGRSSIWNGFTFRAWVPAAWQIMRVRCGSATSPCLPRAKGPNVCGLTSVTNPRWEGRPLTKIGPSRHTRDGPFQGWDKASLLLVVHPAHPARHRRVGSILLRSLGNHRLGRD
jgi:hypothetical protein